MRSCSGVGVWLQAGPASVTPSRIAHDDAIQKAKVQPAVSRIKRRSITLFIPR